MQIKINLKEILNFKFICIFILLVAILLGFQAMDYFWAGFHNVDIGYNIGNMERYTNLTLRDTGSDLVDRSGGDLYSLGLNQMFKGFYQLGLAALMGGIALGGLVCK